MKLLNKYCLSLLLMLSSFGFAQESGFEMSYEAFMELVKTNHPVAKQARLNPEMGLANRRAARGGFDPGVYTHIGQKYFQNDQYYSLIDAGLKIPTWFGVEVYGGFEQNNGINLNPERKTPHGGLVYAGVAVPIGKGLFIDQRRADLKNANLFLTLSEEEQRLMLNNIMANAANAYWDWYAAYTVKEIFEEAVSVAEERLTAVKRSAFVGESPTIDTVEAAIQLQNRMIGYQNAKLEFENQNEQISVFLWNDDLAPLEIADNLKPTAQEKVVETVSKIANNEDLIGFIENHPLLNQNEIKLKQLDIERRLKAENLKPTLNLKYNAINEPINNELIAGYSLNNYTWGLDFSMPIFVTRARGELKLTKLKIQDAELDLTHKKAQLLANAKMAINAWKTSNEQLNIYTRTVENSEILFQGEQRKFEIGESSLFLVNARETSLINTQIEYTKMIAKNQKSLINIDFQLGVLGD